MTKIDKPKTDLDYNDGSGSLPEGAFRISASQFNSWMNYPHNWYREQVLGETGFNGNTASVLGTVVHYCAEMVGKGSHPDVAQIEQYITNCETLDDGTPNEDVDASIVRDSYEQMATTLINTYLLQNMPTQVEPFVMHEIQPGYFPSGSIDAINGDCIVDYKTFNSKTKPKAIPQHYKYQLLIYAYICRKMGMDIQRIRLVYINRPIDGRYISEKTGKACGKIHPPEVTVLTECIDADDMDFIESLLNLCTESVQKAKEDPSLAYLIFRDYRLKDS